ncbi:MAG: hypothetical protein IJ207_03290 [Treponema sp.]|uniref:hypothetical protein n=1 Tax=Treponema sp. TaxID=166 RepID=UPI0025DE12B4|nr:hypothetical protein [Treponema sp.]MBQ9281204.1 hypothetical protein [Treponema sp.]
MKLSFGSACMFFVLFVMLLTAKVTGEAEIIFPEVAALSCGCFLTPRLVWRTSSFRMIFCIAFCAVSGVAIVRFLPLPLWAQFSLAFLTGQLVLLFSGTTFAPLISAIALPVLIQTRSPVYILAAVLLTTLVCLLRAFLVRAGKSEQADFSPVAFSERPFPAFLAALLFRTAFLALLAFFCIRAGLRFCVAPPLLVAFTELTGKESRSAKRFWAVILLVSLCALFGAASRLLISVTLGLPLTLSGLVAGAGVILLVKIFAFPFPPAAAMAVLAMLIPKDALFLYPLEVAAGIFLLSLAARFWRH